MRFLQMVLSWLWRALCAISMLIITVHPNDLVQSVSDVPNRIAGYFELIGFQELAKVMPIHSDAYLMSALVIAAVVYVGLFFWKRWLRPDPDVEAVQRNFSNGWRVSRLVMKTRTRREGEYFCQDFLAQPYRTDEVNVLAARAIRQHRAEGGIERGSWEFWRGLEDAMHRHGPDAVICSVMALNEDFPPSLPLKCWMKYRQWREKGSKRLVGKSHEVTADSISLHLSTP